MSGTSVLSLCLLIVVFLLTAAKVEAQTRAQYGDTCSRTNRCDSRASLTCTNGTCECIMPEVMRYDGAKCAVVAGEKCTFTAVDIQSREEERSWREELPCVKNAACQESFCTCLPDFYESTNGTCIKKRGFQEDCEFNLACKNEQLLYCNDDKTCGCNASTSTFDLSRQLCVTKAGLPCENAGQCVPHGTCVGKMCKCDSTHFQNSRGECEKKRGHNEPCETNSNCQFGNGPQDLQLVCTSGGICECRTDISMYNPSNNLCVKLAGEVCTDFPNCVDNSVCSQTGNFKMCTCNPGYFKNPNGICESRREHGNQCEFDENCQPGLKCSPTGLCDCDHTVLQQIYDSTKGKCVTMAGVKCKKSEECVVNSGCYNHANDKYECDRYYGCDNAFCRCRNGFTKSKNGACLASSGSPCSKQNTCNEDEGTICKDGKCVCKFGELQTFYSSQGKCHSSVLGPCDDSTPCVENAHCSEKDESYKQCVCNEGYISVDGQCFLGLGQQCDIVSNNISEDRYNYAGQTCDKAAPLSCIQGECQCEYLEEYDLVNRKCIGLVGSRCEGRDDGFCTPNAECVGIRASQPNLNKMRICKCKVGWMTTQTRRCVGEMVMRQVIGPDSAESSVTENSIQEN